MSVDEGNFVLTNNGAEEWLDWKIVLMSSILVLLSDNIYLFYT